MPSLHEWYRALDALGIVWDRWYPASGFRLPLDDGLYIVGAIAEGRLGALMDAHAEVDKHGGQVWEAYVDDGGTVRLLIREPDFIERDTPKN